MLRFGTAPTNKALHTWLADARWVVVDVQAVAKLPQPVSLDELKDNPGLNDMLVVQRGQRLSVQPVAREHVREVLRMGGLAPEDFDV